MLSSEEQSKVFIPPRKDQRKLIIGTNIAESSITIPDVDCVIDFCLTKENVYNSIRKSERLELNWASKASAKQVYIYIYIYICRDQEEQEE